LNYIRLLKLHFTVNTFPLHYQDQEVRALWGDNRFTWTTL